MKLFIIAVGKIKEDWIYQGISQYQLWLKRYTDMAIIEVQAETLQKEPSPDELARICDKEGVRLSKEVPPGSYTIALDRDGTLHSSLGFSDEISRLSLKGESKVVFLIGGPFGLSGRILSGADSRISLSTLTFPHPLARLILLEQLYRGFSYIANHPYHK